MSSKRGQRRTSCAGKRRFETFAAADAVRLGMRDRLTMSCYKCKFCSFYHIGHTPVRARQAARAKRGLA